MPTGEDEMKSLRTLLVDLPFQSIATPNLGLSLIQSVLRDARFACDIRYADMEFAKKIGASLYMTIAQDIPHECLFGDYLFSQFLRTCEKSVRTVPRPGFMARIPNWLWQDAESLQTRAYEFVQELGKQLAEQPYDVFGFNLMFQTLPSIAVAQVVKRLAPEKLVILGGSNCEASMGIAIHRAFPWIDYVCQGEGENVVIQLYQWLSQGSPNIEQIAGLVWRCEGKTKSNLGKPVPVEDLDCIPCPSFHDWIDQLALNQLEDQVGRLSLPLETSRGCWYGEKNHCIFCGLMGERLSFRRKSVNRVLNELDALLDYKIENVFAVDLIFPNEFFKSLLPVLQERAMPLSFFYEAKANLTKSQLLAMKRAGINQLQPGIESLNSNVLQALRKGVFAYQNIRLLKWSAEIGIGTEWNMLVDVPGVPAKDYDAMTKIIPLILHLRAPTVGCHPLRVDRFSPLEFRANDFGISELKHAPAYKFVYGLSDEILNDLAYFFESAWPRSEETSAAIARLSTAVRNWHQTNGEITLIAVEGPDRSLQILDNRPCAVVRNKRLSPNEARLFRLCDAGATLEQVATETKSSFKEVEDLLSHLVELKLILFIDGRYLSLPTDLSSLLDSTSFPEAIFGTAIREVQKSRMRPTWRSIGVRSSLEQTQAKPYFLPNSIIRSATCE
jgi:ribosomal peptide maturation radical SAM protein 1